MLFRLKTGKQFIASIAFAIVISAKAGTINVPSDFKTIQAALFAAIDGDEVVVAPAPTSRRSTSTARRSRYEVRTDRR
ncbi:MAG: hypothetical protein IH984_07110 [Planctomycetes bacterium]|nr:hypothetical protein [Planctomycetota bacterium]